MMMFRFALLALVGCPSATPTPTPSDTDTDTDVPTPTDPPTPTGDTGPPPDTDPPIPVFDCTTVPSGPFGGRMINTARGYHGLAFSEDGLLVGADGNNLLKTQAPGQTQLFVPNIGGTQQMNYLPNGDLAISAGSAIQTVQPNGTRTTLASGINAYGVEVGPDGMIYTANQTQVHRIDPNGTSGAQVVIPSGAVGSPKVVAFDLHGTQMFVGTNNGTGSVHRFDIDANGDPVLPGQQIAQTGGSWHDGIGMDVCGRIYVAEYFTRSLYMIRPGVGSQLLLAYGNLPIGNDAYGHGLEWGSGIGDWDDHFLYVPLPYNGNTVAEVELGYPWVGYNGGNYEIIE